MSNIDADLVLHLTLDEIRDGKFLDASGDRCDGVIKGNVTLVPDDVFGACASFPGAAGSFIEVPDSGDLRIAGDITVEAWVYLAGAPADWVRIIGKGASAIRNYGLWYHTATWLFQRHSGSTAQSCQTPTSGPLQLNTWYHMAAVLQGNSASLYIHDLQGRLLLPQPIKATWAGPSATSADPLTIGYAGYHSGHKGKIANVRVYKRALSQAEIEQDIRADCMSLVAFRKSHPIDFRVFDDDEQAVLYISDDQAGHNLNLELHSTSTSAIQLTDGQTAAASDANHHFALRFRPGTLSDSTLKLLINPQERAKILKQADQWDLYFPPNLVAPANAGPNIPPVAEAQLALKATFQPDKGFLGVQAQLTPNSYLLSKACHLTGGFAFYSWFAGSEHDGDFVLTLGGYHPHFRVPEHYPTVPRLGFNWQVSPELSLKGDAYFALTASVLMAGGHLEANWRSGSVHAWFKLGADFLIAWKPYHYEIAAYVDMGVEVTFEFFGTQHITFHTGADLKIWGPEFSGEATIHLWIVSFTVQFGAAAPHKPQPIEWMEFKSSFLPADKDVCSIAVTNGMIGKDSQDAADLGIINPKHFSLATNSIVPSTTAQYALKDKKQTISLSRTLGQCGIASMAVAATDLTSTQTITIKREGVVVSGEFDYTPIFKKAPTGLWGESLTPEVNGKQFVENALSGFEIRPKTRSQLQSGGETAAIERRKLQADGFSGTGEYRWENVKTFTAAAFDTEQKRRDELRKTLATGAAGRNAILAALGFTSDDLGKIALSAAQADDFLIAPQIEQS